MAETNTRSVILRADEVRAVRDGRQTQIRRVIQRQPQYHCTVQVCYSPEPEGGDKVIYDGWPCSLRASRGRNLRAFGALVPIRQPCPYGRPGERLWAKETWWPTTIVSSTDPTKPSGSRGAAYRERDGTYLGPMKWRPARSMPRWAARITLEVTDVRVQRVQDISPQEAVAEGMELCGLHPYVRPGMISEQYWIKTFSDYWDSINAKRGYGWDANPWVWAITFRKVANG